jgi:hypothetical protein
MTVIDLEQRRATHASADVTECPECSGQWFELRRTTPAGDVPGIVCMNAQGRISGFGGELYCQRCGHQLVL